MFRILIMECMLSGVFGAIAFRLAWAFSKNRKISWGVVGMFAIIILIFVSEKIDVRAYGEKPSDALSQIPFAINLLRDLCLVGGAWLASHVIKRREKLGLEKHPRFKDFP